MNRRKRKYFPVHRLQEHSSPYGDLWGDQDFERTSPDENSYDHATRRQEQRPPRRPEWIDESISRGNSQQVFQHLWGVLLEKVRSTIRKFSDNFGSSSGKRRTSKIKRGTFKNGAESSIFLQKAKVL